MHEITDVVQWTRHAGKGFGQCLGIRCFVIWKDDKGVILKIKTFGKTRVSCQFDRNATLHETDAISLSRQNGDGVVWFPFKNDILEFCLELGNLLRGGHGKILLERKTADRGNKTGPAVGSH